MPAEALGFTGWGEFIILRFFLKHATTWSRRVWSRCISCRARIAIFLFLIVQFIMAHLSIQDMPSLAAVALFTFRDAMFIFAFFGKPLCWPACGGAFPCGGGSFGGACTDGHG